MPGRVGMKNAQLHFVLHLLDSLTSIKLYKGQTVALAASVISRMNHYLKSAPVARVKESELKGPRGRLAPLPYRPLPPSSAQNPPPRMPARKG
ncbi:unnamed protein product [Danaus chrysippus]|uniref:(African queen) hypothetical protein n=1 Tax=Danaus chrysippus TaxID=151541 RepID=A0A8J2VQN1_9NEOP|nr:unnamed protein product [Danaus chrysippus]